MQRKLFENIGYPGLTIDYDILMYVLPLISAMEWQILCFIMWRTVGSRNDWAAISYTEITEGLGIASRTTVSKGLKKLLDRKMILTKSRREGGVIPTSEYSINRNYEMSVHGSPENGLGTENGPTTIVKDNTIVKDSTIVLKKEKKLNKEKKERSGKKDKDYFFLLPDHLSESIEFKTIWRDWLEFRKEKGVPVTKIAAKRQIAAMAKYSSAVAIAMVDQSINNGWRGIFKLNENHHLMRSASGPLSDAGQSEMEPLKSA